MCVASVVKTFLLVLDVATNFGFTAIRKLDVNRRNIKLFLLKLCWCCPVVIKKKRIHLPSKWRKSVKKVETYCDNLDGDQNENPESVLERLQEGNQLTGTRLLKCGTIFSQMNYNNIPVWKVKQTKLWVGTKVLGS